MVGNFVRGALLPLRGFWCILTDARLLALSALPVALALVLYAGIAWVLWTYSGGWFESIWPRGGGGHWWGGMLEALRWFFYLLFLALLVVGAALAFVAVVRICGAPFFDSMSLRIERRLDPAFQDPGLGPSLVREIFIELSKLAWGLFYWVLCLLSNLAVPGLGAVLGLALAWYFLALEFLSWPMDRRGLPLGERRRFLRRHFGRISGFVAVTFASMLVPLLPIVAVPCCVVGGTLLYVEATREAAAREARRR